MARRKVSCSRTLDADARTVWASVRDFCRPWHPLVTTMRAEDSGRVRAFQVRGEDTVYREQLIWFSDTEMSMRYVHLEGIAGVDRYEGRLQIVPDKAGCETTMSAIIDAPAERANEVAEGTAAIFEIGLEALARNVPKAASEELDASPSSPFEPFKLKTDPPLTLDKTPSGDGPLCLFLHGIGGQRSNWAAQLAAAGAITPSAALDLRGYGDSALGGEQTSLQDHCDDILKVADALKADRLILCGLSYGAWIATAFAEKYPDRMAGLILSGGCTGMSEADAKERNAFRTSREVPLDAGQTPADFAPAVMDVICGPNATAKVRAELQASMAAIPVETYRDALHCFTNPPGRFDFSRLTIPVLMMTGEHDVLAPPSEIRSVAERILQASPAPDVRFEVIAGAGHVCNVEAPDAYNAPMLEFLRRVAR